MKSWMWKTVDEKLCSRRKCFLQMDRKHNWQSSQLNKFRPGKVAANYLTSFQIHYWMKTYKLTLTFSFTYLLTLGPGFRLCTQTSLCFALVAHILWKHDTMVHLKFNWWSNLHVYTDMHIQHISTHTFYFWIYVMSGQVAVAMSVYIAYALYIIWTLGLCLHSYTFRH